MKNTLKISALFLTVILQTSCSFFGMETCDDIACFTPPQPFHFEILTSSRANISTLNDFELSKISIYNETQQLNMEVDSVIVNDKMLITSDLIGWDDGVNTYRFDYDNNTLYTLTVDAQTINKDCCTFTEYKEVSITGGNSEKINDSQVENHYKVTTGL